ncbi:MAG: cupin domain-containing protein [Anaerolineae bacterium]|nr:cupin domain-containing protein [Anaerolineae bacterium]
MSGKFTLSSQVEREQLDWGEVGWVANPPTTEAQDITVMEVTLKVGAGHNFHKHPDQEEVIYVMAGQIEQWLEEEKMTLNPGDSIFIEPDVVHASFNIGDGMAKLMVVLGPCIGEIGYEVVDVADEEPWKSLR